VAVIYFVDGYPPKPYDASTIRKEPTGGTMADVIILAETLARRGHEVFVLQPHPPDPDVGCAHYLPLGAEPSLPDPTAVIYVRGHGFIREGHLSPPELRKRSPLCRFIYSPHVTFPQPFATWWGHAYGLWTRKRRRELGNLLQTHGVEVVGVSAYHAETIRRTWPRLKVHWIYNPVEDVRDEYAHVEASSDRILYASSPERGLRRAIAIVARVRRARPETRLYVATPGYADAHFILRHARRLFGEHAVELGHLNRPRLFTEMRRALCLLQPNTRFLESFGRVYAEAHVLGTPVLTSPIGAAPETVARADQFVDPRDIGAVADRILEWADGARPRVSANPAFAPDRVAARWEGLIAGGSSADPQRAFAGQVNGT
jgi:glycosyltransferase involved in cell wall biosynthesis